MKRSFFLLLAFLTCLTLFAQEPGNNLGKSLSLMKKEFPELRYIKTDQKGEQYEDGFPQDGISMFFYFNNNVVIEECMICQSNDGFSLDWFRSLCKEFNKNWPSNLRTNTLTHKEFEFSYFLVDIIFVSENGQNTALIVYSQKQGGVQSNRVNSPTSKENVGSPISELPSSNRKLEWYEIDYTEKKSDVYGMQVVGRFTAKSSLSFFGSRTYSDAFHSAIKNLQKKAAKKGVRRLLITYKSGMNDAFLTVNVEALGYK